MVKCSRPGVLTEVWKINGETKQHKSTLGVNQQVFEFEKRSQLAGDNGYERLRNGGFYGNLMIIVRTRGWRVLQWGTFLGIFIGFRKQEDGEKGRTENLEDDNPDEHHFS